MSQLPPNFWLSDGSLERHDFEKYLTLALCLCFITIVTLHVWFDHQPDHSLVVITFVSSVVAAHVYQQRRRSYERRLQVVLQNMPVLLSVYDNQQRQIVWNAEAARVTGYSAAEVIDDAVVFNQMYPDPKLREHIYQFRASHKGKFRNWVLPTTCKDGSVRYISWSSVAQKVPIKGWVDWAVGTDITERVVAEQRTKSFQEITAALAGAATPEAIASIIVNKVAAMFEAYHVTVYALTPDGLALQMLAVSDHLDIDFVRQNPLVPIDTPAALTDCVRLRKPLWLANFQEYAAAYPQSALSSRQPPPFQAVGILPLIAYDRVLGGIGMSLTNEHSFTPEEKELFYSLAQQAAQALDRAQAYKDAQNAQHSAEQRAERLTRLQAVTMKLSGAHTVADVAHTVIESGYSLLHISGGGLAIMADDASALQNVYQHGYSDELARSFTHVPLTTATPGTDAMRHREAVWINNASEYQQRYPEVFAQAHFTTGTGALVALPLLVQDKLVGELTLTWASAQSFSNEDRGFILGLAQQCAQAVDRVLLTEAAAYDAERRERQRLARELHDAVSQSLFSAAMLAESIPRVWERRPEYARQLLDELVVINRGAAAEMRNLLVELRPDVIVTTRLDQLMRQLVDSLRGRERLNVVLQLRLQDAHLLPEDVQVAFYRIGQEALTNVVKHAKGSQVIVGLRFSSSFVRLRVWDNGQGFDTSRLEGGIGLHSMHERAREVGAQLRVYSRPGRGMCITMIWKVDE